MQGQLRPVSGRAVGEDGSKKYADRAGPTPMTTVAAAIEKRQSGREVVENEAEAVAGMIVEYEAFVAEHVVEAEDWERGDSKERAWDVYCPSSASREKVLSWAHP